MRRTLTIDDKLDRLILSEVRRSKESFKSVVNRLLTLGLQARKHSQTAPLLKIVPVSMGLKSGVSLESIADLEELLESRDK